MPNVCPPLLRTVTEFAACVPADVAKLFWQRAQQAKGLSWVIGQQAALKAGGATIESAYVFQLVPVVLSGGAEVYDARTGQTVGATYEEARPRSLAEANWFYACELMSDAPMQLVRELCRAGGAREDINEFQMRAAASIIVAGIATEAGVLIPQALADAQARTGAGASFFEKFGNGLGKLFQNPGEWAQRVFITEPGKALQWAGRQLLSITDNSWARWILDPLGFARQFAVFLREIGSAMVAGALDVFEEQEFAKETARHWQKVGAALAVAAPFLPPPWNIAALALSAVFTAAGVAVLAAYAQAARQRLLEKQADQEQAEAEAAQKLAAEAQQMALAATVESGDEGFSILGLDGRALAILGLAALGVLLGTQKR